MGLNDYLLLLLGFQRVSLLKREGKDSLLMHALIFAVFSLFFLPLFFFLFSVLSFFLNFFVFLCLAIGHSPFSSMATSPFYSELIPWDFSFLPLGLHQLFLVCCGHSLGLSINPLVARPLPLFSTFSLHHYSFHDKFPFVCFCDKPFPSLSEWIKTWVSHYLPLWHASGDLAIHYLFWAKCHPNKAFSQKRLWLKTQNKLFSPHHQTTPSESLDCGPTSLVLARYRLVVLLLLCACSTILYFCLLLFPQCFCRCKLVLFRPTVCLFYPCLSFMEEGMGSWACLVFFCLFFFFFFLILFSFSFMHFLLLSLSYFFMHFLLCLSFPLVWFFFLSHSFCYWHFLLFFVSFHCVSSY